MEAGTNRIGAFLSRFRRKRDDMAPDAENTGSAKCITAWLNLKRARRGHDSAGYTLVELLVVLAILALLVGIATPMVLKYLDGAKVNVARIQVSNFEAALDLFDLDMDRYPTEQEGLQALLTDPDNDPDWHGPYLKNNASLKDPWGQPYNYRYPGQHKTYDLWSNGPHNGADGGNPEISNW